MAEDASNKPETISMGMEKTTPADSLRGAQEKLTVLEQLRAEISKKVERPDIEIGVPERPGVSVRFSPNVTQNQLRAWRKNSGEDSKDGFDPLKFACYVVGSTTQCILINDEIVTNEDGIELTFASGEILDMTNDLRPIPEGIRSFYGVDPHLESTALAILDAAGYGEDVELAANPTKEL